MTLERLGGPALAFLIAWSCALAAVSFPGTARARRLVPVSGALLVGTAAFGLIPELGREIGWPPTLALVAAGYGGLTLLDKLGYPVCPSCSHGAGFAAALLFATGLHAFVDGWGMAAVGGTGSASAVLGLAILLHKLPEGLALGTMLRAAEGRSLRAALLAGCAELPTVVGGALGARVPPGQWLYGPLALAGGTFLFLGIHAMEGWRGTREHPVRENRDSTE